MEIERPCDNEGCDEPADSEIFFRMFDPAVSPDEMLFSDAFGDLIATAREKLVVEQYFCSVEHLHAEQSSPWSNTTRIESFRLLPP